jgi:hypothetical protein
VVDAGPERLRMRMNLLQTRWLPSIAFGVKL